MNILYNFLVQLYDKSPSIGPLVVGLLIIISCRGFIYQTELLYMVFGIIKLSFYDTEEGYQTSNSLELQSNTL